MFAASLVLFSSLISGSFAGFNRRTSWNSTFSNSSAELYVDVAVIGGGASGTLAALKLKDANKTVALIEKSGRLGGHTETYHDPTTGGTVDVGVVAYESSPITHEVFGRYNIPLSIDNLSALSTEFSQSYIDFKTSTPLPSEAAASDPAAIAAALEKYAGILTANYSYLETGFDLPDPVPEELLLPFGDFVSLYSLDAAVFSIASYAQGFGDILSLPTLYVLKFFNLRIITDMQTGFLATTAHDNSLLYESATNELASTSQRQTWVFFNSDILYVHRTAESVTIKIDTPVGPETIHAEELVFAIPPKVLYIDSWFDMDTRESFLLSQFQNKDYFTALVRNSGLSPTTLITNVDPTTPYYLPTMPGIYNMYPSGVDDLYHVYYGANETISSDEVKADILSTISDLRVLQNSTETAEPEFAYFSAHDPFLLTVSSKGIKKGFYAEVNKLQGYRRTWYTGAAWHTHHSSLVWEFTESLVKRMLREASF